MNQLAVRFRRTGALVGATLDGPATAAAGDLVLAWDGRLDNREELGARAGLAPAEVSAFSDEGLLLRLYARLGVDALPEIVGDYAFALWDPRARVLFCARDPLGQRPFFYYASPSTFVAASSLAGVLAHSDVPRQPNEGVVAEYLLGSMATRDETLYSGVRRLVPGSWMRVGISSERHGTVPWVNPGAEIRYAGDDEYADHLRDLIRIAVRARLRGVKRVGVELSGGLDSSTVAAIARDELGIDAPARMLLLSLVFPGLACDERSSIETCRDAWRLTAEIVPAGGHAAAQSAGDVRHLDFPSYPNGAMSVGLRRRARAAGAGVILTGIGGDEWFSGSRYHVADALRGGRVRDGIRQARLDAEAEPTVGQWTSLWNYGVRPVVPRGIKRIARRVRGAITPGAPWIPAAFAARADLGERLRRLPDTPAFPTAAQTDMFRSAIGGWAIHATEMEVRQAREIGIELRHPLADMRIARFGLAIPESQRWCGRERKRVLRAAAAGLVPDAVRVRGSKVDFTPLVVQALDAQGGAGFFRDLGVAALGWVNAEPLERLYAEMHAHYRSGDPRYMESAWILWMVGGVERWARAAGFVPSPLARATA